jgi:hypothetical protein
MKQPRFLPALQAVLVTGFLAVQLSGQEARPTATSHELQGRDDCLMCHRPGAMEPVPDVPVSHEGRTNATCLWCHAPDAEMLTTDPPHIPHELAGRDNCLMCHAAGAMEAVPDVPASHAGRTIEFCRMCHEPAGG